jgi:serine/threonine protein kinase
VTEGQQRVGPYILGPALGKGGQASVYRATGPDGRSVALKRWFNLGADPDLVRRRVAREAELVGRIRSAGVVTLIEARPEGDLPYLVFEFVEGSNLEQWLAERGPLTGEVARQVMIGLLRALVEVHAAPIAHLDIKPANIILRSTTDGPQPVLVDFGIARPADVTHTRWTGQSTPFASPEQLEQRTAYTPSDLFSFASVAYFMVTGRFPFGEEPALAQARIRDHDWLPPREPFEDALGQHAPGLWDAMVDCWHRDPVLRWPLLTSGPSGSGFSRPTADTYALLERVEHTVGGESTHPRLRRGRINPRRAGPTPWHELGAHMRHRRRHGANPMTVRQLVSQRELLGRVSTLGLLAYEMGWREPPYEIVAMIDAITGGQGYLKHLYVCARHSDRLGLPGRPRGSRYPVPGDRSEQHEETPDLLQLAPWREAEFPVTIRNTGMVEWVDRFLMPTGPVTGTETVPVRGSRFAVPRTPPGGIARMGIPVRAPGWPAVYRQRFKMVDADGEFCFPRSNTRGIEVMIQVVREEDR